MDNAHKLTDQATKTGMKMLQHVNQALSSLDPQLVMGRVRETMLDGEELQAVIDEIISHVDEGTEMSEMIHRAGDELRLAMAQGGEALTASESFIKNNVHSMRDHIDAMMTNLNSAAIPVIK